VRDLTEPRSIYDIIDSMLNRDIPFAGERADVIPTASSRLIKLFETTPDDYRLYTMFGLPKAYLADHPVEIITNQIKIESSDEVINPSIHPEKGNVYIMIEDHAWAMQRQDNPKVSVEQFSFNHVQFDLPASDDVTTRRFLIYQDAWHPEWTATAGGVALPVWPANIAFKAVEIPPQVSQITFHFGSVQRYVLAWLNALLALAVLPIELTALLLLDSRPVARKRLVS
jgi:hypothetical protein